MSFIPLGVLAASGAGGGGSFESIATAVGTGSSGTITFSSIPSTYKHLQIRATAISADTDSYYMQLNSDSGSNYAWHRLVGAGTAAVASGSSSTTSMSISGGNSTFPRGAIIDVHDYASTTKNKTVRTFTGIDQNTAGNVTLYSGLWMSVSAVSSISIILNSGNFDSTSVFALYGIKG